MGSFAGFPSDCLMFLSELEENNTRAWFQENKARYLVLEEASQNVRCDVESELSRLLGRPLSSKVFRLYRDVRFSKDKTPYNPFVRIAFYDSEKRGLEPSFYMSLEARKCVYGCGALKLSDLSLYRKAVLEEPSLDGMKEKLLVEGVVFSSPDLKRIPRGYPQDHPQSPWLLHKGLCVWREDTDMSVIQSASWVPRTLEVYRCMRPLYRWMASVS